MGLFSELLGTPQAQDHDGIFSTSSKYYARRPASENAASAAGHPVPASPELAPLPEKKPLSRKRKHTPQDAAPALAPPSQSDLDSLQLSGTSKARGKTKNKPKAQAKQTAAAAQLATPASGKSARDPTPAVQDTATELASNKRQKRRQALAATASRPAGNAQVIALTSSRMFGCRL